MSSSSGDRGADEAPPPRWRALLGPLLLAGAGAALGTLPHLIALARTGDPAYVADMDDLLYLAWSRDTVLHGRPHLVDAVLPASGPMMHPWLLFVPPGMIARGLGLDMTGLGIVWRGLAGAGIALGLYAAARPVLSGRSAALAVATLLTFDAGFQYGQPFAREARTLVSSLRDQVEFLSPVPQIMAHLRVVTPGLAIPVLLLHYHWTLRARTRGGTRPAIAAAAGLGLLFYTYFYFWTAAWLGVTMACALDPKGRRLYAIMMVLGLAIGAPSLWWNYSIRAETPPDWLLRTDKFVSIGHCEGLIVPKLLCALWVASGLVVFRRRSELTYLWCVAGAGLACVNHQLVTGLEIENYHWIQVAGLTSSLLLALIVAPIFDGGRPRSRAARAAWTALLAMQVGLGMTLRWQEATRPEDTQKWMQTYRAYRRDRKVLHVPPGAVVAGDGDFFFIGAALADLYPLTGRLVDFSSLVKDDELDERLVLNLYLLGVDREWARSRVSDPSALPGGWWVSYSPRPGAISRRRAGRRLALVDPIWDGPGPYLKEYGVTHVVLRRRTGDRDRLPPPQLGPVALRVTRGETWDVWQIDPTRFDRAGSPR